MQFQEQNGILVPSIKKEKVKPPKELKERTFECRFMSEVAHFIDLLIEEDADLISVNKLDLRYIVTYLHDEELETEVRT